MPIFFLKTRQSCSPYDVSLRISMTVCPSVTQEIVGKLAKSAYKIHSQLFPWYEEAAWVFLCRRFYYHNGRRPVLRPTRSRLYKRDHSPLWPNFDPPHRREFWKREGHKRRSPEDRGFQANPGCLLDISSRLSCWFRADVKEPYPRYVRLFSSARNFLIFTMCQSEIYVYVG